MQVTNNVFHKRICAILNKRVGYDLGYSVQSQMLFLPNYGETSESPHLKCGVTTYGTNSIKNTINYGKGLWCFTCVEEDDES